MTNPVRTCEAIRRRALLLGLTTSPLLTPTAGIAQGARVDSPVLVAFLSRSGNTRVVAGQLARANRAELFEIVPADPYPEDYRQTVDLAKRQTDAGVEPALQTLVTEIARYQTVFLGFPIWGMTAPPPIRSFLAQHDLSGKTLVPFITHGGYGTGQSLQVLKRMAPGAKLVEGFVMQADQERDTLERVTRWLERQPSVRRAV
jgi:flavodoxin